MPRRQRHVDHHVTNPHYAEVNLVVSDAAATAEIVYELYGMFGVAIDKRSAICLYTGIVTDTGNLSYSNTTECFADNCRFH